MDMIGDTLHSNMSNFAPRKGAPRSQRRPRDSAGQEEVSGPAQPLTSINVLPPVETPTGFAKL